MGTIRSCLTSSATVPQGWGLLTFLQECCKSARTKSSCHDKTADHNSFLQLQASLDAADDFCMSRLPPTCQGMAASALHQLRAYSLALPNTACGQEREHFLHGMAAVALTGTSSLRFCMAWFVPHPHIPTPTLADHHFLQFATCWMPQ